MYVADIIKPYWLLGTTKRLKYAHVLCRQEELFNHKCIYALELQGRQHVLYFICKVFTIVYHLQVVIDHLQPTAITFIYKGKLQCIKFCRMVSLCSIAYFLSGGIYS